jgi:hypothetical protein
MIEGQHDESRLEKFLGQPFIKRVVSSDCWASLNRLLGSKLGLY